MPSWAQGFVISINVLRADHEIKRMITANVATKAREAENSGKTRSSNTSGSVVLFREDTSGTHTPTDKEIA